MVPKFIFICDFSNLIQSFITNDESRDMVVIHYLFNGNSWSISTVCCWCNDTYYVLIGLYDDFSCWLSFARLARIYPLYCCCDCYFIFYISILSGVIQVCSSRPIITKLRSFVCELDLWSFFGNSGYFSIEFCALMTISDFIITLDVTKMDENRFKNLRKIQRQNFPMNIWITLSQI